MNAEMLEKIVKESEADIKAEVKRRVIEGVQQDIVYAVREMISKQVKEFVDAEVLPELKTYLTSHKGPIVAAAKEGANAITESLKTAMISTINEKMKTEWHRKQVVEALFK